MQISITRLRIRSVRYLPVFLWTFYRTVADLRARPGFLAGRVAVERWFGFWTVTAWKDAAAIQAFRNEGIHLRAMGRLPEWCDEASVAQGDFPELPDWPAAHAWMRDHGRASKVRRPSARHQAGKTAGEAMPWPKPGVLRPR
jgi:hypothetical protein